VRSGLVTPYNTSPPPFRTRKQWYMEEMEHSGAKVVVEGDIDGPTFDVGCSNDELADQFTSTGVVCKGGGKHMEVVPVFWESGTRENDTSGRFGFGSQGGFGGGRGW